MHLRDPEFPPLFSAVGVKAPDSPLSAALSAIGKGEAEAGDLFWARAVDIANCALVLEPEYGLARAMQIVPVAMVALGDAIGAIGPPNLGITYGWPGLIYANGGHVGDIAAYVAPHSAADTVPQWLVLTMEIVVKSAKPKGEPGDHVSATELWEEGAGDLDRTQILESFARHLLAWIDTWETDGFRQVHEMWMFRAADRDGFVSVDFGGRNSEGTMIGLDENGGLLVKTGDGISGIPLTDAVNIAEPNT